MTAREARDHDACRREVRDLVAAIEPLDDLERTHRERVLAWIDRGEPLHRTAKPATPPTHLVSYALVVDRAHREVLLIDHRLAGRWLPTGGHVEPGEHPADAAHREVLEELAVTAALAAGVPAPLLVTAAVAVNVGETEGHTDMSLWFVFDLDRATPVTVDATEASASRWWPIDSITHRDGSRFERHLPRALAKLAASTPAPDPANR